MYWSVNSYPGVNLQESLVSIELTHFPPNAPNAPNIEIPLVEVFPRTAQDDPDHSPHNPGFNADVKGISVKLKQYISGFLQDERLLNPSVP